ncbi:hypothetical protein LCGC14_2120030 [marine sediment metagenome]|uniref:PIN domain-containing protein n=1 Tax=marine sediment metagenome TaxID=412755 RepID=A0A0F9E4L7_9ZZZZ
MGENLFDTNRLIAFQKSNISEIEGYTTIFNIIEFPKSLEYFKKLKIIYPSNQDYQYAIILSQALYKIGKPIPPYDIIIAAICYNLKLTLVTSDKHYSIVKEIWNDFHFSQK